MNATLRENLQTHVLALSFPAFCHLIRLLLYRSGYSSVHFIEPVVGSEGKERVLYEGLVAVSHTDLATALTLVRVKQALGAPVSRRFVDQMRGAMLRLGAEHGLLLATGQFSEFARETATQTGLRHVRLVEGGELLQMLLSHRLGVRKVEAPPATPRSRKTKTKAETTVSWEVDDAFFAQLEERAARTPFLARKNGP